MVNERCRQPEGCRYGPTLLLLLLFLLSLVLVGCGDNGDDDKGTCDTGTTETRVCPDGGEQSRTCLDDGTWGEFSQCPTQEDTCEEGTHELPCGYNDRGTRTQICEQGTIVDHGVCNDPDVCKDGEPRNANCGNNGIVQQICTEGQWVDDGACNEQCDDGDTDTIACGLNDNGSQSLLCQDGEWVEDGACNDPDICLNGDFSRVMCPVESIGTPDLVGPFAYIDQVCEDGAWNQSECQATSIDMYNSNGCAVKYNGEVICWGPNNSGQLGVGHKNDESTPVTVRNINNATQVAVGGGFACALTEDQDVYCWGSNANGKLGTGDDSERLLPSKVVSLPPVRTIAVGYGHACALTDDDQWGGEVYCWGSNGHGQLGIDATTPRFEPTKVLNLGQAGNLFAYENTTCAAKPLGFIVIGSALSTDIYCWGENADLRAGLRDQADRVRIPTRITSSKFNSVATAGSVFCGVHDEAIAMVGQTWTRRQQVMCIGTEGGPTTANPAFGDGSGEQSYSDFHAIDVIEEGNLPRVTLRATGRSRHNAKFCAHMPSDGRLFCWGNNGFHLGRGDQALPTDELATPENLTRRIILGTIGIPADVAVEGVRDFAMSYHSVCIINDYGHIECSGGDSPQPEGRLGRLANIP